MARRDRERPGKPAGPMPAEGDSRHGSGHSQPTDAGRTSGGGNLGHDQPPDVEAQTHTRNAGRTATGSKPDPVTPRDARDAEDED